MTGDAVGLPGVAVGDGVGFGDGSGAGADDEGMDDGIEDGVSTEGVSPRFFLSEASATPKTYPNPPPHAITNANPASSHRRRFHFMACFLFIPPGSWPYRRSEGFNTTIL